MDTYNNNKGSQAKYICQSANISEIYNKPIRPATLDMPIVAKIPVVLSHTEIQLQIESIIKLDSRALYIRDCVKEIRINGCKLYDLRNGRHGKLYLKGYIYESLEYSEPEDINGDINNKDNGTGIIRNMIVNIPFECSTKVDYITPPVFKTPDRLIQVEMPEIHEMPNNCFYTSVPFQANNSTAASNKLTNSHGLLFELEESDILDSSITTNTSSAYRPPVFDNIIQDIIVRIKFSLLQKQFVKIFSSSAFIR